MLLRVRTQQLAPHRTSLRVTLCRVQRAPREMPRLQVQAQRQVWALDFDGVVCDSVGESAIAAWKVSEEGVHGGGGDVELHKWSCNMLSSFKPVN